MSDSVESPTTRFELDAPAAHRIVEGVLGTRGVAKLHAGTFGEVSLLYPGERVAGLKRPNPRDDHHLEVHIVFDVAQQVPVKDVAEGARAAALEACSELSRVDVVVADAISSALDTNKV
ncbi:hypothetical protein ACMXZU_02125 [Corynebacterium striatum]